MVKSRISAAHTSLKDLQCKPLSFGRRLLLLGVVFILMFFVSASAVVAVQKLYPASPRNQLMLQATVQNICLFAVPALLTVYIIAQRPLSFLGINKCIRWQAPLGIIIAFILGLPFLNQLIYWNQNLHLPQFLSGMEATFRGWEDSALQATSVMLGAKSAGAMLATVLVVGVLTGICEELFFRGAVQRILHSGGMNHHIAIWLAAFIFSAFHFQFFGFFPRLLLGAFFGYLFYWSGSIWASATAHAINNSIVVFVAWLGANGSGTSDFENIGVATHSFPWIAVISFVLVISFICGFHNVMFANKRR